MPDQTNKEELRDRVANLEQRVRELERQLEKERNASPFAQTPASVDHQTGRENRGNRSTRFIPDHIHFGEQWLNRIGIGLLLFGVAFLFKYSIDQGWLIPPVRTAIGLGIGCLLFGTGIGMREATRPFRQVLMGGGIAVFYITGFATYQLYSFLPGMVIWSFMIVVTLLALSLSLQQDEAILSVTGMLGALGTPFMLYSGTGDIVMLMLYTSLVLAAGAVIYFQKGWTSLLWSMLAGGFGIMGIAVIAALIEEQPVSLADRWVLQGGMAVWALATWGVAVARDVTKEVDTSVSSVHLSVFWVSLWLLLLIATLWDLTLERTAPVAFGFALVGAVGYLQLSQNHHHLANSHAFMGLIMLTTAVVLYFNGTPLFILLASEAIILRQLAHRTRDQKLSIGAHILFIVVIMWTFNSLWRTGASGELNIESFVQLAFLAAAGALIPYWLRRTDIRSFYRLVSHLMILFWIHQIFAGFAGGQAWVSVLWGLYAIGLLVSGFTWDKERVRFTGMATIFLVVAKLFLVDLSQLQALWRILLFIGFGGVFVLLGYYLQSRWNNINSST